MAVNKDNLANSLAEELNKKYKGGKIAFFLNDESTPTDVKDFISTGSSMLDFYNQMSGVDADKMIKLLYALERVQWQLIFFLPTALTNLGPAILAAAPITGATHSTCEVGFAFVYAS